MVQRRRCWVMATLSPVIVLLSVTNLCVSDEVLIKKIYDGLRMGLEFYAEYYEEINLDGMYGLVLTHALLSDTNQVMARYHNFKIPLLLRRIEHILDQYENLDNSFNLNYDIYNQFLMNPKIWRRSVNFTKTTTKLPKHQFDVRHIADFVNYLYNNMDFTEEFSDGCMSDLILSSNRSRDCWMDSECAKVFISSDRISSMYCATHRLLYIQSARALQCSIPKSWLKTKIHQLCSFIFWEAKTNARYKFIGFLDDLLFQQMLLCGYEGYAEFLSNRKWIEHLLSKQDEELGCFIETAPRRARRNANIMQNGCVDHSTGVGIALYSLVLRYLTEVDTKNSLLTSN